MKHVVLLAICAVSLISCTKDAVDPVPAEAVDFTDEAFYLAQDRSNQSTDECQRWLSRVVDAWERIDYYNENCQVTVEIVDGVYGRPACNRKKAEAWRSVRYDLEHRPEGCAVEPMEVFCGLGLGTGDSD